MRLMILIFWRLMSWRIQSKHPASHPDMRQCRPSTPRLEDELLYLLRKSIHISKLPRIFQVRSFGNWQFAEADL